MLVGSNGLIHEPGHITLYRPSKHTNGKLKQARTGRSRLRPTDDQFRGGRDWRNRPAPLRPACYRGRKDPNRHRKYGQRYLPRHSHQRRVRSVGPTRRWASWPWLTQLLR